MATAVVSVVLALAGSADAQRAGRRVATLDLLDEHSAFFHGEEVIIHADAIGEQVLTYLVDDRNRLLVLDVPPPLEGTRERLAIIGTFYDVGRLEPRDPRIVGLPFERLSASLLNKAWPGVGELPLIVASSSSLVSEPSATTLRAIALDPEAYLDQGVSLTGRFRGRNLFGDLPDSPAESPYDFVLTSADAAVWIVGKEPKGEDFDLDVQARIDTGRWLEVRGSVRMHEGMVIVQAGTIALAEPAEPPRAPRRVERRQGPPPEVIFSTPLDGDTDIPTDTIVRIQFSRDMDPDSFDGRVRIEYPGATAAPGPGPTTPEFETEYRAGNRVLEIRLMEPLRPFTALSVALLEGITSTDDVALSPWTLSFFSGP